MRAIGMAERALEIMVRRASERETFGKLLLKYDTVQRDVADCRVAIHQARLVVMDAARQMDKVGAKRARLEIAVAKVCRWMGV